ncbi:hypothetical protein ENUP19_0052G0002 [Entamoeba nuttalli]|uniref:Uncharacterized protein n=2 Tax=Entamoeba nuttalli TaxID=412467 RepID=K2GXH4_ENTNP|nr:hypothetical protein ENU1_108590 [Entamoeba nuttalli P19]EKE39953.1 hypothetical protein ENU1_108590 [Entamoeba nuttalli P19]|eukprot:XP_008857715.1 hypothetical protein ENU1_108590 [Entamoeba nuttalli P19]
MLVFLTIVISLVNAQFTCKDAVKFNLPTYFGKASFGSNTSVSQIIDANGQTQTAYGIYYKATAPDDFDNTIININTCDASTVIPSEILIFEGCSSDGVASNFKTISGIDNGCSLASDFPVIDFEIKKGVTYYILVKLVNPDDQGVVSFSITSSHEDNPNVECNVAKEVTQVRFVDRGLLLKSKVPASKPLCYKQAYPTLWYKIKGDGRYLVVNTCNYYTNFDTHLVVVKELNNLVCTDARCMKEADDGCGKSSKSSILAFKTEVNEVYYIGVRGNLGEEGQFEISIDYLSESIPATCTRSLPIKLLPFTRTIDIPDAWPTQAGACLDEQEHKSVYLTLEGTGSEVVISTCKSLDSSLKPIGVSVELINNCEDENCAFDGSEYGECGENNYIVKKTEKGQNYYIKAYCNTGNCEITLSVYEKASSHDTCESARELIRPTQYSEIADVKRLQTSIHGCHSVAKTDAGLWYLLKRSSDIVNEKYTILGMSATRSKIAWIEFPYECGLIQCEQLIQGEAHLSFAKESQYIFVYSNNDYGQKGLIVQFISEEENYYHNCPDAMFITLPFTAIHSFDNSASQLLCSSKSAASSFYRFVLPEDQKVDVSTCFPKTIIDTGIEITTGCFGDSDLSASCIDYNSEGKGCVNGAAAMSVSLKGEQQYYLNIYSESKSTLNLKQYRFVIFTEEVPKNSVCNKAIELPYEDGYSEYLVLNRYSKETNFGSEYGTTKGSWFHINVMKKTTVTVRTCSPSTTSDSLIVTANECYVTQQNSKEMSNPTELEDIAVSGINNCDIHGTYLTFNLEANQSKFIFVGPQNFNDEAFIGVEFYMNSPDDDDDDNDSSSSSQKPTESSSSNNNNKDDDDYNNSTTPIGWIIFGVLFYVLFVIVLIITIIAIKMKRKNSGYATLV